MSFVVEKTEAFERIEHDLERAPEVKFACLAILDFIATKGHEFVDRLTFGQLTRVAALGDVSDVVPAIQYLTGARLHLLEPRFEFIDEERDFAEEVPLDVVARARADRIFYHPHTGEPVEDFERSLFMFFVLSGAAKAIGHVKQ